MEWGRLITAVLHTPWWVWGVFVYMLYMGVRALRPKSIYPPDLLILPLVMVLFKFPTFFAQAPYLYLGTLAIGGFLGVYTGCNMPLVLDRKRHLLIPGGINHLVIVMSFFFTKYIYGLMHTLYPELAQSWSWIDISASGLLPGYSWGKGLTLCKRFFQQKP
jgi:teichoic acid transport system permease protein